MSDVISIAGPAITRFTDREDQDAFGVSSPINDLMHPFDALEFVFLHRAVDWRLRGRAIRRLVTLSDSVTDILAEADRRGASEAARQTFSEE